MDFILCIVFMAGAVAFGYLLGIWYEYIMYKMPVDRIIQSRLCKLTCLKAKKELRILELYQSQDDKRDSKMAKLEQELFSIDREIRELNKIDLKKTSDC